MYRSFMPCTAMMIAVWFLMPLHLKAQEYGTHRMTPFDSLIWSGSHAWNSGKLATIGNKSVLDELIKLYPEGISHEQVNYDGKHKHVVDRWIVIRSPECHVYEYKRWEWGGVFGFENGVEIPRIDDFKERLERAVGKVSLPE